MRHKSALVSVVPVIRAYFSTAGKVFAYFPSASEFGKALRLWCFHTSTIGPQINGRNASSTHLLSLVEVESWTEGEYI